MNHEDFNRCLDRYLSADNAQAVKNAANNIRQKASTCDVFQETRMALNVGLELLWNNALKKLPHTAKVKSFVSRFFLKRKLCFVVFVPTNASERWLHRNSNVCQSEELIIKNILNSRRD